MRSRSPAQPIGSSEGSIDCRLRREGEFAFALGVSGLGSGLHPWPAVRRRRRPARPPGASFIGATAPPHRRPGSGVRTWTARGPTRASSRAPRTRGAWRPTASTSTGPTSGRSGRANLDGTGVDQNFIPEHRQQPGSAGRRGRRPARLLDRGRGRRRRTHRARESWTAAESTTTSSRFRALRRRAWLSIAGTSSGAASAGTLGIALLSGGGAAENLVSGGVSPAGVASNGQYLYWTNSRGIGRYNGVREQT